MAEAKTNLSVKITADLANIKAGLASLKGDFARVKADSAGSLDGLDNAGGKMAKFASAAKAGLALVSTALLAVAAGVKNAIDGMDTLGEKAKAAGIGVEAFSKLAYAAQFAGVEVDQLGSGFVKFNKQLVENEDLINKVGTTTRDAGNYRPLQDIILDLSDVFKALPEGPERSALAIKLFGKSGADLIPVLIEGKQKLQEYGDEAVKTGNALTEEAAAAADEFNDNLGVLTGTLKGVFNETAKNLLPALTRLSGEAKNNAAQSGFAAKAGDYLAKVFKYLAAGALYFKGTVEVVVNVLAALVDVAIAVGKAMSVSVLPYFKAIGNYWQNLKDKGPVAAIKEYIAESKKIRDVELGEITNLPAKVKAAIQAAQTGVQDATQGISDGIEAIFSPMEATVKKASDAVNTAGKDMAGADAKGKELAKTIGKLLGGDDKESGAAKKVKALKFELDAAAKAALAAEEKDREAAKDRVERIKKGLADVEIALLRASGNEAEAAFKEIDQKYAELITYLKAVGDKAGLEIVDRVINVEKINAKLDEFKGKAQTILSSLSATETSLSGQSAGGLISPAQAEQDLNAARAVSLQQLSDLKIAVEAYYEATKDPAVLAYIETLKGQIGEVVTAQQALVGKVKDIATGALSTFFTDLATGAKTFKQAFLDLVRSFVAGIAQMIAQKLALKAVDAIATGFGFHTGGVVGQGSTFTRQVNPMLFGVAPRYHTGGIAGLGANEVPAILERGEEVLTKRDARHRANGGKNAARGGSQRFIFVDDQRRVSDYLNTADGEEALVRVIGQNSGRIREALA